MTFIKMKKDELALCICAMMMFIGAACSKTEHTPEPEPEAPPKIEMETDGEMTVSDMPSQVEIVFSANRKWTVASSRSWCRPAPGSGEAGKVTVTVEMEKNEGYDSREAVLTLQAETAKMNIKIIQVQCDAILPAKSAYEVECGSSVLEFELQSNVEFQVSSDAEWITPVAEHTRGLDASRLKFNIAANPSAEARTGHIRISKGGLQQTVTVTQKGVRVQVAVISHQMKSFRVPLLEGTFTDGLILWGDGKEESYRKDALHEYAAEQEYALTVKGQGAAGISLPNLKGIVKIDLSGF